MEDLLMNNYTAHYGLLVPTITNFIVETDIPYLEIEDTNTGELVVHNVRGAGMANFANANRINLIIVNYDKFVTSLPQPFQDRRKRCDVLVSCDINRYFILGELKNRIPNRYVRRDAKKQLIASLKTLLAVQEIFDFANNKSIKRCCYFNKQSTSPTLLTATTAFNRLNRIYPDGFKMSNKDIEDEGFEFYEYTGGQTMILTR
jgi:hypothetical protein